MVEATYRPTISRDEEKLGLPERNIIRGERESNEVNKEGYLIRVYVKA